MFEPKEDERSPFIPAKHKNHRKSEPGFLLITDRDEIIYANNQARKFLGILSDESLPPGQNFLSLVQTTYACYPDSAWNGWPQRPSMDPRYLIFNPTTHPDFVGLRVDILEQIVVNANRVWVVSIAAVEAQATVVSGSIFC